MQNLRFGLFSVVIFLSVAASNADAHSGSSAYIHLTEAAADSDETSYLAHIQFKLEDLHEVIWMDSDNNGAITWREVKTRRAELMAFALESLTLQSGGKVCEKSGVKPLSNAGEGGLTIEEIGGQYYADLTVNYRCTGNPEITYTGLLKFNSRHRAFLTASAGGITHIFTVDQPTFSLPEISAPFGLQTFNQFLTDGMFHVFTGYDHVLFLVLLLLPSVVVRREKKWQPEPSLRHCSLEVLKIVTAFTCAHSFTMGLAVFKVVNISASIIEPVIAFSILVAAINNLWPYARTSWLIAAVFGLVHGFGFASLLQDTGIGGNNAWFILGAFNIGIEAAQAMIVLLMMPLLWRIRSFKFYTSAVLAAGSCCAAIIAIIWTVARVF